MKLILDTDVLAKSHTDSVEKKMCMSVLRSVRKQNHEVVFSDEHKSEIEKKSLAFPDALGPAMEYISIHIKSSYPGSADSKTLLKTVCSHTDKRKCKKEIKDDWFLLAGALLWSTPIISAEKLVVKCLLSGKSKCAKLRPVIWLSPWIPADRCTQILKGTKRIGPEDRLLNRSDLLCGRCDKCKLVHPVKKDKAKRKEARGARRVRPRK